MKKNPCKKIDDHVSTVRDSDTNVDEDKLYIFYVYKLTVNPDSAILKKVDEIKVTVQDYVVAVAIANSLFFRNGMKLLYNAEASEWDEEFNESIGKEFGEFWYSTDGGFWVGGWNETIGEKDGEMFIAVISNMAESKTNLPHFFKRYDTFLPLIIL